MCHAIRQYVKGKNKYMKYYDKIKNRHVLNIEV